MSWAPYAGAPGASYFEDADTASVASLPNFLTATKESAAVVVFTPSDVMPASAEPHIHLRPTQALSWPVLSPVAATVMSGVASNMSPKLKTFLDV